MKAIVMSGVGGPEVLSLGDRPDPVPHAGELLVRVKATALNRADLLQRRGLYAPPPGASDLLGLEMAGEVVSVGTSVDGWSVGDRVCALLPGGGYAQLVTIPAGMAMGVPPNLGWEEAAGIPEVFLTAYLNLFDLAHLGPEDRVLIHAGASGVGTAALQVVRAVGATAFVTAGSQEKIQRCLALGATAGWNHREGSFGPWILDQTRGQGVDIVLDFVGAPYWADNLGSLALDGRLCLIGTLGGTQAVVDLGLLMRRRLTIRATTLRSQSGNRKEQLTAAFVRWAGSRFAEGSLAPVIDRVFPWTEAADAHRHMEANASVGKIILRVE